MYHPAVVAEPLVDSIYLRTPNSQRIINALGGGQGLYAQGGGGLYAQGGKGHGMEKYCCNLGKTLGSGLHHPALVSQPQYVRHPNAQKQVDILGNAGKGLSEKEIFLKKFREKYPPKMKGKGMFEDFFTKTIPSVFTGKVEEYKANPQNVYADILDSKSPLKIPIIDKNPEALSMRGQSLACGMKKSRKPRAPKKSKSSKK